jgi:hypothetical protein
LIDGGILGEVELLVLILYCLNFFSISLMPLLYHQLNELSFYHRSPPRSLGREWMERDFFPILLPHFENISLNVALEKPGKEIDLRKDPKDDRMCNILNTLAEHVAFQIGTEIGNAVKQMPNMKVNQGSGGDPGPVDGTKKKVVTVLVTGGGAYNRHLIER